MVLSRQAVPPRLWDSWVAVEAAKDGMPMHFLNLLARVLHGFHVNPGQTAQDCQLNSFIIVLRSLQLMQNVQALLNVK